MADGAPTAVCGALGRLSDEHRNRIAVITRHAQAEGVELSTRIDQPEAIICGNSALEPTDDGDGIRAAWNAAGAVVGETLHHPWPEAARRADACGVRIRETTGLVHGSVSGAQVIYVQIDDDVVFFSTRLRWLADSAERLSADWQSWAEIIGFGAPLEGRTTFTQFRRLMPMEYVEVERGRVELHQQHWPWEDYTPEPPENLDDITHQTVEAMAEDMRPHLQDGGPAHPMLSGGRDSRILTALALRETPDPRQVTAWTTSSDAGSALEELVGARVAHRLGVPQRIVVGSYADFGEDFERYVDAVDYQASFHFWLTPVAEELSRHNGPIFDGLGGGVLLGGGFADPPDAGSMRTSALVDARISARARYLSAATKVFSGPAAQALSARSRVRAAPLVERYLEHPNGHTLAAYRMRSVPGIAPAPARVLGDARPTLMPMVSDAVARLALQLPHRVKADGAWYPDLLAASDPRLQGMQTADDLVGTHHHKRRIASREGAGYLANLILGSEVRGLLSHSLANADPKEPQGLVVWQRKLNSQRTQHLLRGLATLALWLDHYATELRDTDPRRILDAG